MIERTKFHEGRLTVSELMSEKPATVPMGTSLLRTAEILSQKRYRHALVSDRDGRLVGIVSSNDVLSHMAHWNQDAAKDWENKTVESVMTTKFIASSPNANAEDVAPLVTRQSIECVPVLEEGKLVGVLTSDDIFMSWNRLDPVLREAATDSVTDLANRATFNRRLEEEWDRARRLGTPLGVIIIDVDHFKRINDTCGHMTGDAVLHMVGSCLRRQLRSYDLVARYAGDEFAAICSGCQPQDIDVPIARLQNAVRNLSIPSDPGCRRITLSIGAAVICRGFDDASEKRLVTIADDCLYHAKRNGRDRAYRVEVGAQDESGNELTPVEVPDVLLTG